MRNIQPLALRFIVGILITLFSITGCSDMPYTGSVLTVREVDRYLVSTDGNVVCFQDDIDSTCIKLGSETGDGADGTNGPAIHIYPEKRLYLFYHEGNPILRAERVGDIPQNGGGGNQGNNNGNNDGNNGGGNNNGNNDGNNGGGNNNGNNDGNNGGGNNNGNNDGNNGGGNNNGSNDGNNGGGNNNGNNDGNNGGGNNNGNNDGNNGGGNNNGNNDGNNGGGNNNGNNNDNNGGGNNNGNNNGPPDNSDDGHGWIIWIYYPEGTVPPDSPTLSESGVTITINGEQVTDDDITGFAQFTDPNNDVGVQFFYETKSAELLDLKVRMEGVLADADDVLKFNINYLWNSQ